MKARLIASVLMPALLAASSAWAASFIVPSDRELTSKAEAVVIAIAQASVSRINSRGGIETVTTFRVEDVLKGMLEAADPLEVVTLGGSLGSISLVVPDSPRFVIGERSLLFLARTRNGSWTTVDMILGKFNFVRDAKQQRLLIRSNEIFGWNRDGLRHVEPFRDEARFLRFLRHAGKGEAVETDYYLDPAAVTFAPETSRKTGAALTASDFAMLDERGGVTRYTRFDSTPPNAVRWLSRGTQPNVSDSIGSLGRAIGAWTSEPLSSAQYEYDGTTSSGTFSACDNQFTALFNDPENEIQGSFGGSGTLAIGGFCVGSGHTFAGQPFGTISDADLVVQDGIGAFVSPGQFEEILTHEFGHTLGIRHSDESGRLPNTTLAIMNSTLNGHPSYGTTLQPYDRQAVQFLYPLPAGGGGSPGGPCSGLCLIGNRFEATLVARDQRTGNTGVGSPLPQSDIFGYFSIPALTNNATNPEVFVKVLDAGGKFWVFYGGLTDFEFTLTIRDTKTSAVKTYFKEAGSLCGGADTRGF